MFGLLSHIMIIKILYMIDLYKLCGIVLLCTQFDKLHLLVIPNVSARSVYDLFANPFLNERIKIEAIFRSLSGMLQINQSFRKTRSLASQVSVDLLKIMFTWRSRYVYHTIKRNSSQTDRSWSGVFVASFTSSKCFDSIWNMCTQHITQINRRNEWLFCGYIHQYVIICCPGIFELASCHIPRNPAVTLSLECEGEREG